MDSKKLILLTMGLATACSVGAKNNNSVPTPLPAPTQVEATSRKLLVENPELVVENAYSLILSDVVPIDGEILIGERTIAPQNYDLLETKNIGNDLLQNFKDQNADSHPIKAKFDIYATARLVKVDKPISPFLESLKRESPRATGLILFSQVGTTPDLKKQVVYSEFYSLTGKVLNRFCIISLNEEKNSLEHEWLALN